MRQISRGELSAPALVIDLHSDDESADGVIDTTRFRSAYCLIRRAGKPSALVFLDVDADTTITPSELRRLFAAESPDYSNSLGTPETHPVRLTVVICTRNRTEGLLMTLASLAGQTDPSFEVLIVDNSSDGDLVRELGDVDGLRLRVVHEPQPGLSHARNRGLAEVNTEFVAWIDDDEKADAGWIEWLMRAFTGPAQPDVVAGLMLPAELETQAQVDFERYGGFNKGRGIEPEHLRAKTAAVPNSIYPLPNFGAGGNMAFRAELLKSVGGFEPRLGAGTLTHGGEETRALSRALDAGALILHWPPAITWHYHRRTDAELTKQFYGYSAGLSAFYMSLLLTSPRYLWRVVGLVPRGVADLLFRGRSEDRPEDKVPDDFPVHLLQASRRGLLAGAFLYLRERVRQRRHLRQRRSGRLS